MLLTLFFPVLLCLALGLVTLGARHSAWFAWSLVPLFGGPFVVLALMGTIQVTPFTWAKVSTLLVVVAVYNTFRFTNLGASRAGGWVLWGLLAVNIAEAVAQDWSDGFWLRGAVGVGLIVTQGGTRAIRREGKHQDLTWTLPLPWVLAYTAWNLSFAARFYVQHTTDHVSHLLIPLLWMLVSRKLWFQMRGYALAIYGLAIVTWIEGLGMPWPEPIFRAPRVALVPVTVLAAGLLVWHTLGWASALRGRARPSTAT